MKTTTILFFCLALLASSCKTDEPNPDKVNNRKGMLFDGSSIIGLNFYGMGESDYFGLWRNNYDKVEPCKGYESLILISSFHTIGYGYNGQGDEEKYVYLKLDSAFHEKTKFIEEPFHEYEDKKRSYSPFYTAYLNGKVSITCNKKLFGREPGEDLSQHFALFWQPNECLPIGKVNPTFLYQYGDTIPTELDLFFTKDTWLQMEYHFRLTETPKEKYDELQFRISIPVAKENWVKYFQMEYKGDTPVLETTEEQYTADCIVKLSL